MFEILPTDHSDAKIRARLLSIKAAGYVRLDEEEIEGLAYALAGVPAFRISLFGSRTHPDRRGGDIDILLLTDTPPITVVQQVAVRFFPLRRKDRCGRHEPQLRQTESGADLVVCFCR